MESHLKERPTSNVSVQSETKQSPELISLNCVENHLQSLGFVINNGEARFQVDNAGGNTDFSIIDAEDPASFIVLGKDSMESIQASCLASYMDIQHKSVSVDYNSMISSLDSNDIHQKLMELLQENGKLKEAMKQNNTAMKQQISILSTWQEEMMKVHMNYKNKFVETTELIKYLKKENCELKMKLSMDQFDNSETGFNIIDANTWRQDGQSTSADSVQPKAVSADDFLDQSQWKCGKFLNQIEKFKITLESMNSNIMETVSTLENQLPTRNLNVSLSQIRMWNDYITKLQESKDFFHTTEKRCYNITTSLNDAIKILEEKIRKKELNINISNYMDLLSGNCKRPEQKTSAVDLQNNLENVLSQYESILYNFTTDLRQEVSEMPHASESVKLKIDAKRSLEEEKLSLMNENESLCKEQLKERNTLIEQEKSLEIERKKLNEERDLIMQKMISLDEEKTSLDRQCQLYENSARALQADKKALEIKIDSLTTEAESARAILTKREDELKELQKKNKQQEETMYSLGVQMKVYEEDFTRERQAKDALLLDYNKVVADLTTQLDYSKHLHAQLIAHNNTTPDDIHSTEIQSPEILSSACPKCQCVFRDATALELHVEVCLDLH